MSLDVTDPISRPAVVALFATDCAARTTVR